MAPTQVLRPEPGAVAIRLDLDTSTDLLIVTDGAKSYTFGSALTGLADVETDAPAMLMRYDPDTLAESYRRRFPEAD